MIPDALLLFSDSQVVTMISQVTAFSNWTVSTNLVDLSTARDIGVGENLYLVTVIDVAASSTSAAAMDVCLFSTAISVNTTVTVVTTDTVSFDVIGTLAPGSTLATTNAASIILHGADGSMQLSTTGRPALVHKLSPSDFVGRYAGLWYRTPVAGTGASQTVTVTSVITKDVNYWTNYAGGFSIAAGA